MKMGLQAATGKPQSLGRALDSSTCRTAPTLVAATLARAVHCQKSLRDAIPEKSAQKIFRSADQILRAGRPDIERSGDR